MKSRTTRLLTAALATAALWTAPVWAHAGHAPSSHHASHLSSGLTYIGTSGAGTAHVLGGAAAKLLGTGR